MGSDGFLPAASLDGDQDAILSHLERSTPVRLMATIGTFIAADATEPVAEAISRADRHRFDYLPVREGTEGPVVGLFARKGVGAGGAACVREVMQPLSSANLIAIDAPLLQFVLSADNNPCPADSGRYGDLRSRYAERHSALARASGAVQPIHPP